MRLLIIKVLVALGEAALWCNWYCGYNWFMCRSSDLDVNNVYWKLPELKDTTCTGCGTIHNVAITDKERADWLCDECYARTRRTNS
jgi:hypothetical protein